MHALVEDMPSKVEAALSYGQSLKNPVRKEYQNIIKDIKRVFVTNYQKNVDVHFFGSRLMGLATHDSDLDTYIDLGKELFAHREEFNTILKSIFFKVNTTLRRSLQNLLNGLL